MGNYIKPSARYAEYVHAILKCGHWEATGRMISKAHAELRHLETGKTIAYNIHDGGSELNSARNFATEAQSICGCTFITPRGRKKSRKKIEGSGFQMPTGGATPPWVEDAWGRHGELCDHLDALRATPNRDAIQEAAEVIEELSRIEPNLQGAFQAPPAEGWVIDRAR